MTPPKRSQRPRSFYQKTLGLSIAVALAGCAGATQSATGPTDEPEPDSEPRAQVVVAVGIEEPQARQELGLPVVSISSYPQVGEALQGRDEEALSRAMSEAGVQGLVIARDRADPQLLLPTTLARALARYSPTQRFHAVRIDQEECLYAVVAEPFDVSDEAGAALVELVRAELTGAEKPPPEEIPAEVNERHEDSEVAVSLQGLRPESVSSSSRNARRRDYFVSRSGASLREATIAAARRLQERWQPVGMLEREGPLPEAMDRLWIEVEVIHDRTPIDLRQGDLTTEAHRRYLWQAIELGVHGLRGRFGEEESYFLPSSAVYRSRPDVRSFLERLARNFDLDGNHEVDDRDGDHFASAELRVDRFRTVHFREMTPAGEVRRLRRGYVPVDQDEVTRAGLQEAVRLSAGWLADNVQDDGLFEYKYYPTRDTYYREFHPDREEAHNIVRHGLASYALFMAARELDDDRLWAAAERSLEPMLERTVIGPAWYQTPARSRLPAARRQRCRASSGCESPEQCADGFCRLPFGAPLRGSADEHHVVPEDEWESHDGYRRALAPEMIYLRWKDVAKMGSAAVFIMVLSEMIAGRPALLDRYRPYLEGYWAFLRFMQRPDGSFNHYFTAPSDVRYYSMETTIYPGEILLALSQLYRLLGDEAIREAFDRGYRFQMAWFRREVQRVESDGTYSALRHNDLTAFVPWMVHASHDMYLQTGAREQAEAGVELASWVARFQWTPDGIDDPAYHGGQYRVWWEQPSAVSLVFTEAFVSSFDLARRAGLEEEVEGLRVASLRGVRFGLQQIVRPGVDDHYFPNVQARERSRGGVRFSMTVPDLRTDYSYHAISSMIRALRYLRDEEWEVVGPLPGR